MVQTVINIELGTGIPGQIDLDVPRVVRPYILDSSTLDVPNYIGYGYTRLATDDAKVTAGGTGIWAGILVDPKTYSSPGSGANSLASVTSIANNKVGQLLLNGSCFVIINDVTAVTAGNPLYFGQADGKFWATTAADRTRVPNARIDSSVPAVTPAAIAGIMRVMISAGIPSS